MSHNCLSHNGYGRALILLLLMIMLLLSLLSLLLMLPGRDATDLIN